MLRQDLRYALRTCAASAGLRRHRRRWWRPGRRRHHRRLLHHRPRAAPAAAVRRARPAGEAVAGPVARAATRGWSCRPANYRDWKRQSTIVRARWPRSQQLASTCVGDGEPERARRRVAVTPTCSRRCGVRGPIGRALRRRDDDREGAPGTVVLSDGALAGALRRRPERPRPHGACSTARRTWSIGVMPRGFRLPEPRRRAVDAAARSGRATTRTAPTRLPARRRPARARRHPRAGAGGADAGRRAAGARSTPRTTRAPAPPVVDLRDEVSRQARLLLLALLGAGAVRAAHRLHQPGQPAAGARAAAAARAGGAHRAGGRPRAAGAPAPHREPAAVGRAAARSASLLAGRGHAAGRALVPTSLPDRRGARRWTCACWPSPRSPDRWPPASASAWCPRWRVAADGGRRRAARGPRGGVGGQRERLRAALVVAEVAAVGGAAGLGGLLLRALWRVQAGGPRLPRRGRAHRCAPRCRCRRYEPTAAARAFYAEVLDEVRALPGVASAAYISFLPMVMRGGIWPVIDCPGQPDAARTQRIGQPALRHPGFFATLRHPAARGPRRRATRDTRRRAVRGRGQRVVRAAALAGPGSARPALPAGARGARRWSAWWATSACAAWSATSEPQVYLPSHAGAGRLASSATRRRTSWSAPRRSAAGCCPRCADRGRARRTRSSRSPTCACCRDRGGRDRAARGAGARAGRVRGASASCSPAIGIHGLLSFVVSQPRPGDRRADRARRHAGATSSAWSCGEALMLAGVGAGARPGGSPTRRARHAGAAGRGAAPPTRRRSWPRPPSPSPWPWWAACGPARRAVGVDPLAAIRTE